MFFSSKSCSPLLSLSTFPENSLLSLYSKYFETDKAFDFEFVHIQDVQLHVILTTWHALIFFFLLPTGVVIFQKTINEKCRKLLKHIAFYSVDCRDSCGEIFADLQDHSCTKVSSWFVAFKFLLVIATVWHCFRCNQTRLFFSVQYMPMLLFFVYNVLRTID